MQTDFYPLQMKFLKMHLPFASFLMLLLGAGSMDRAVGQEPAGFTVVDQFRGDYAIKNEQFAIWNGKGYIPVFIKGINLGISVPGTQPGQLAASSEDYRRWFHLIREAGYNTMRVYTLHFPRFYEELRKFNLEHPQSPLMVMHGIWLEENEVTTDLFLQTAEFDQEIREAVAAVHGDIVIASRPGKAHGSFTSDISPWVIGFLPGREIQPAEVALTNQSHPGETAYSGAFFQLPEGDPVEVWLAQRLNNLMIYEYENYQSRRPTGFSSWPTLDPLTHPTEQGIAGSSEDSEQIDLADMVSTDSSAGFFIGYHAYPYYPDFIVEDPYYKAESDQEGPNNYLGYLRDLKSHYKAIPLLIAEFGVPSSWGAGHQSSSGMNHGGLSEEEQGKYSVRMFDNLTESGCAGGIQFSLIDEWFKQTWITNPYSNAEYRHFWHNITAPEQNFGILAYAPPPGPFLKTGSYSGASISGVKVASDYTFFRIRVHMKTEQFLGDTLWVALDTYESNLGESILPDGRSIATGPETLRAEFALGIPIGGDQADLFVIPAYDVYGIKSLVRVDTVVSASSDAGNWNPVRWKTDYHYDRTQYIGELQISASEDPYEFLNAVTVFKDSLEIRIPWTLINFSAPTVGRAMHYVSHQDGDDVVIEQQDTLSDGIALTLSLKDELYQVDRYTWDPWDYEKIVNDPPIERKKESFHHLKQMLPQFNSSPIGIADSFTIWPGETLEVEREDGLLRNDFDIDGNPIEAVLAFGNGTTHGSLQLHPNGSFHYTPDPSFSGDDFFMYYLDDSRAYSTLVPVSLHVGYPAEVSPDLAPSRVSVFPNPGDGRFCITIAQPFGEAFLRVVDLMGREIVQMKLEGEVNWVNIENRIPGMYLFNLTIDQNQEQHRILIQ
ncbi:MAG: T9SS type A sorting domain-containing protein [Bacteroidia bacterium]|nr:MAG: T9SS type A sorting domain-containing protein [Bacteroidia bacterium]